MYSLKKGSDITQQVPARSSVLRKVAYMSGLFITPHVFPENTCAHLSLYVCEHLAIFDYSMRTATLTDALTAMKGVGSTQKIFKE